MTIEDMKTLARKKGGECLSNAYLGVKTKLQWKCAAGHVWEARPDQIKAGHWCRYCSRRSRRKPKTKYDIADMQKLAQQYGGQCLSKEYVNYVTKLQWHCSEGHVWETAPQNVKAGKWCPQCGRKKSALAACRS